MRRKQIYTALAAVFGCAGWAGSVTAAPTFNVVRPAGPGAAYTRDALLQSVDFGGGQVFNSSQFVYPSSVTGFNWGGTSGGRIRVVSGSNTTGTTGFQPLESQDGNPANVSATDKANFNNRIKDAFSNNNLNNFFDVLHDDGKPYQFFLNFGQQINDTDTATDAVGEILYFERGLNGSNSYTLLQAVDQSGQVIGTPYLVNPTSANQPTSLTPVTDVSTFNASGVEGPAQTMEGLALDISSAFGVTSLYGIKVFTPTVGQNGFTGGETWSDVKIFAVVPEPTGVALVGLVAAGSLLRRRRPDSAR